MDDPKIPEIAEDVDPDNDSEDGSEDGSGDKGDTLQDFIERLYQDFLFLRTENHPSNNQNYFSYFSVISYFFIIRL
jgi:hypothetical protein